MNAKKVLIWGITGQTGSYLAELLLSKGYEVVGVSRRTSTPNDERIRHLYSEYDSLRFRTVQGDVTDPMCVYRNIADFVPDEIYNLAAQSFVGLSFIEPSHTTDVTYKGALNILEAIRTYRSHGQWFDNMRFYQASSSEMFGSACSLNYAEYGTRHYDATKNDFTDLQRDCLFQSEKTPFIPNSPYAVAKLAAHNLVRVYRESYGLFVCSGILMNHESPRRGEQFVTRKITKYLANYKSEKQAGRTPAKLKLGNLAAKRDWGHASDYTRAMWLMLQQPMPDDYVIATGEAHSVQDFLDRALFHAGLVGEDLVEIDPTLFRPCEVPFLRGDASKAKKVLGWSPQVSFDELVKEMVESDMLAAGVF